MINGVCVEELFRPADAVKTVPCRGQFAFRIRNQWMGGCRSRSLMNSLAAGGQEMERAQPFVLEADEPESLLGKDLAACPLEYLLHALASSLTTAMVYHASARRIQIEEIAASLEADFDLRAFLGLDPAARGASPEIRVNYRIKANVSDQQLEEICRLGPRHSPVFTTLAPGVTITVNVRRMT
jgi:uncharacterized OsmC-like protein